MALAAIFVFYSKSSYAQQTPYFVFDQSVVIYNENNDSLTRAWCGGFRAPMFSELDANNDGAKDIFVFDRFDKSINIFLYLNGEYVYAPDFSYYFPPLTGWVLLRDYNCDGKNDIFAASFSGVQVWENVTTGNTPVFTQTTNYLTGTDGPVTVLSGDIPAIDDIDNDGDLDIITFGQASMYANYYKNDTPCGLGYSIYTQCWGHFAESGISSEIILGDSCGGNKPNNPTNPPQSTMHQGSTITSFDQDGDGDMELLIGDVSSNQLTLLVNGGDQNDALVTSVIDSFPSSHPVDIYIYNAGYFIDTDHDGDDDLIVSNGEIALSGGRNYNNTWLYENTSTNNVPVYQFRQENFLSDMAIDIGGGPSPYFYDFDHDGDKDMLLGSFVEKVDPFDLQSSLSLYENIGDSSKAIFKLIDSDFGNLSDTLIYGLKPTVGDIDGDNDYDLLVGNNDGNIIFYENLSPPGTFPVFSPPQYIYQGIDVGFASSPELVDLDRDNDLDLLVGEGNGNINYFENIGDATNPIFIVVTDSLGKINMQNSQFATGYGYATPYITQLDSNDNYDLVVGSWDGIIKIFMNIENYSIDDKYPSITNTYFNAESNNYSDMDFETRTIPALADLNGNGLNDMVVGLFRGGLYSLKNNSDTALTPDHIREKTNLASINIYPNPAYNELNIAINPKSYVHNITLYNSIGQNVFSKSFNRNTDHITLELSKFNSGLYFVKVSLDSHQKIVKKIRFK